MVDSNRLKGHYHLPGLIIIVACLALPAISPKEIGWLVGFIPLPVFYILVWLGKTAGTVLVRNAVLLSGGAVLLFGSIPLFIFSLTLVPIGFVFFRAAQDKLSPVRTCLQGILLLGTACVLIWGLTGLLSHVNPYSTLVLTLSQGLEVQSQMFAAADLPAETLRELQFAVKELQALLPAILPAIVMSGILYTVWMNLALGNWLLRKKDPALIPWQEFNRWQLPDNLVWGVIIAGLALLFPAAPLKAVGLNMLIILWALYVLQGLAVLIFLLNRWSTPTIIQGIIYALIIMQGYGILLSIVGLIDVWVDFRKLNKKEDPRERVSKN